MGEELEHEIERVAGEELEKMLEESKILEAKISEYIKDGGTWDELLTRLGLSKSTYGDNPTKGIRKLALHAVAGIDLTVEKVLGVIQELQI